MFCAQWVLSCGTSPAVIILTKQNYTKINDMNHSDTEMVLYLNKPLRTHVSHRLIV